MDQQIDQSQAKSFAPLARLPSKVQINVFQKEMKTKNIHSELVQPLAQINNQLNTMFYNFEQKESFGFVFNFPQSVFPESVNNSGSVIEFHQKTTIEENTFHMKLTQEQLKNIKKDGTFLVNSKLSTMPYKWKIHPFIFKGYQTRLFDWYVNLSRAYHQLRQMQKRVNGQTLSIKLNLSQLILYPRRMGNMFVGLKQMKIKAQPDYDRILELQFLSVKFNQFYNSQTNGLYEYLYCPIESQNNSNYRRQRQKKMDKFREIDNSFNSLWASIERKKIYQYKKNNQVLDEQGFSNTLREEKKQAYANHLKAHLDKKVFENVFELVKIFTIFQVLRDKLNNQIQKARDNITNKLKNDHKIRSHSHYFMNETTQRLMIPIQKALRQQYQQNLAKQLNSKVYDSYLQHKRNYQKKKQKLQQKIPVIYEASRTFHSSYQIFPPYKIIQKQYNNRKYYSLEKRLQTKISTDHNFWKFSLYKMRIYTWSKNCFFYLVALAWVGPLGIKQLLTMGQYIVDQNINSTTGQIIYQKSQSLYLQFLKVLDGIKKSRETFQRLPDTGFFGKNLTRILNYIQCYIFRFLIVGIILLLIIKTTAIIVYTILSVLFVLTIWIWLPLSLVVTYLFNVLIYQFELDEVRARRYRISQKFFPIINTPLMLVLNLVRVIIYLLSMLIIHPLGVTFWIAFALIARTFRTITDAVMYFVFKFLARTPARDTAVAWKVSGPGLSRNYYLSMNQQDIYMLVQSKLQKQFFQSYTNYLKKQINKPVEEVNRVITNTFRHFYLSYNNPITVRRVNEKLLQRLNIQIQKYQMRFPYANTYNVRFTREQLDTYFENSIKIVKSFINKNKASWMANKYQNSEQYTEAIWKQIFGQGILQTLQNLDSRFQLERPKSQNSTRKLVLRALQGQVKLQKLGPSVTRQLKSFNIKNTHIITLNTIASYVYNQCSQYPANSIFCQQPSILFNRNIKQVIDKDQRQQRYDRVYQPAQKVQFIEQQNKKKNKKKSYYY